VCLGAVDSSLQRVAGWEGSECESLLECCSVLKCLGAGYFFVAACCGVLQRVLERSSAVLRCVAARCGVFRDRVILCCSALQRVAVCSGPELFFVVVCCFYLFPKHSVSPCNHLRFCCIM